MKGQLLTEVGNFSRVLSTVHETAIDQHMQTTLNDNTHSSQHEVIASKRRVTNHTFTFLIQAEPVLVSDISNVSRLRDTL